MKNKCYFYFRYINIKVVKKVSCDGQKGMAGWNKLQWSHVFMKMYIFAFDKS